MLLASMYLTARQSLQTQSALMNVSDNAELALSHIKRAVSRAGFIGCPRFTAHFPLVNHTPYVFNTISGNSNSLAVMSVSTQNTLLAADIEDGKSMIVVGRPIYQVGDVVLISDCKHAEIFTLAAVEVLSSNKIRLISSTVLTTRFKQSAELGLLVANTYFVHPTNRKTLSGQTISALYLKTIRQRKIELVEGIDTLGLSYDQLDNGEISTIQHIIHPDNIIGIHLRLTVSSTQATHLSKIWYGYAALR